MIAVNSHRVLDGVAISAADNAFLLPRIYRLLLTAGGARAGNAGINVRYLLDQATPTEWAQVRANVYQALEKPNRQIDAGRPLDLEDIREADPALAVSCYARLCRDEYAPRHAGDLRIMEVARVALENDRRQPDSRQFRNFLMFLSGLPTCAPKPPPPCRARSHLHLV